jgi:hypothetical protein
MEIKSKVTDGKRTKNGKMVTVVQHVLKPAIKVVQRYYLTDQQVIQVVMDGAVEKKKSVVIQGPIAVGTKWSKVLDSIFIKSSIVDTKATVKTPAGTFKGVLVVKQVINLGGPNKWLNVVSHYAPGVGLVSQTTTGLKKMTLTLKTLTRPKRGKAR